MYFVTCAEAARQLGVSAQTVRRRAHAGDIPCLMVNGSMLIDLDALRAGMEQGDELISMEQLSELTGLSVKHIRKALSDGWMTCQRDPRDARRKLFSRRTALGEIARRLHGEVDGDGCP